MVRGPRLHVYGGDRQAVIGLAALVMSWEVDEVWGKGVGWSGLIRWMHYPGLSMSVRM